DVGACADLDRVHVAADHAAGPDGDVVAEGDRTDHRRGRIDVYALTEDGVVLEVGADVHRPIVRGRCTPPRSVQGLHLVARVGTGRGGRPGTQIAVEPQPRPCAFAGAASFAVATAQRDAAYIIGGQ